MMPRAEALAVRAVPRTTPGRPSTGVDVLLPREQLDDAAATMQDLGLGAHRDASLEESFEEHPSLARADWRLIAAGRVDAFITPSPRRWACSNCLLGVDLFPFRPAPFRRPGGDGWSSRALSRPNGSVLRGYCLATTRPRFSCGSGSSTPPRMVYHISSMEPSGSVGRGRSER